LTKVLRSARDHGDTTAAIAAAVGITAGELEAHVFGLALTAVRGDRRATEVRSTRGDLRLVPPIDN